MPLHANAYPCAFCPSHFPTKEEQADHIFSTHDVNSWLCHECPEAFMDEADLAAHTSSVHSHTGRGYTCPIAGCSIRFCSEDMELRHKKHDHSEQSIRAAQGQHRGCIKGSCTYSNNSYQGMSLHVLHRHAPTCVGCEKKFLKATELINHRSKCAALQKKENDEKSSTSGLYSGYDAKKAEKEATMTLKQSKERFDGTNNVLMPAVYAQIAGVPAKTAPLQANSAEPKGSRAPSRSAEGMPKREKASPPAPTVGKRPRSPTVTDNTALPQPPSKKLKAGHSSQQRESSTISNQTLPKPPPPSTEYGYQLPLARSENAPQPPVSQPLLVQPLQQQATPATASGVEYLSADPQEWSQVDLEWLGAMAAAVTSEAPVSQPYEHQMLAGQHVPAALPVHASPLESCVIDLTGEAENSPTVPKGTPYPPLDDPPITSVMPPHAMDKTRLLELHGYTSQLQQQARHISPTPAGREQGYDAIWSEQPQRSPERTQGAPNQPLSGLLTTPVGQSLQGYEKLAQQAPAEVQYYPTPTHTEWSTPEQHGNSAQLSVQQPYHATAAMPHLQAAQFHNYQPQQHLTSSYGPMVMPQQFPYPSPGQTPPQDNIASGTSPAGSNPYNFQPLAGIQPPTTLPSHQHGTWKAYPQLHKAVYDEGYKDEDFNPKVKWEKITASKARYRDYPRELEDQHIFNGDPSLVAYGNMLRLAQRHSNAEIFRRVNEHRPNKVLQTPQNVESRIASALRWAAEKNNCSVDQMKAWFDGERAKHRIPTRANKKRARESDATPPIDPALTQGDRPVATPNKRLKTAGSMSPPRAPERPDPYNLKGAFYHTHLKGHIENPMLPRVQQTAVESPMTEITPSPAVELSDGEDGLTWEQVDMLKSYGNNQ